MEELVCGVVVLVRGVKILLIHGVSSYLSFCFVFGISLFVVGNFLKHG